MKSLYKLLREIIWKLGNGTRYEDNKIIITSSITGNHYIYIKLNNKEEEVYRERYYGGDSHQHTYCDRFYHSGDWEKHIEYLYKKIITEEKQKDKEDKKIRTAPCSQEANAIFKKIK